MKWIDVLVTIDGETFEEAVKATNTQEVLAVASWNWEAAERIQINREN